MGVVVGIDMAPQTQGSEYLTHRELALLGGVTLLEKCVIVRVDSLNPRIQSLILTVIAWVE